VPDYKGRRADQLITRIAPGVVSLVGLRGHERQAAEELEQRKTPSRSAGRSTPRRCVHHPSPPSMHPWPSDCYDLLTDAGYTGPFTGRHSGAPQALQSPPRTCMGPSPLRLRGSPTQSAAIHRSFWIASMLHVPADAR
jgi:hypothetical protein